MEIGVLEALTTIIGHVREVPHSPPELREALRVAEKYFEEVERLMTKEDWTAEYYQAQARLIIETTSHLDGKHAVGALLIAVAITLVDEGAEDKLEAAVTMLRESFRDVSAHMAGGKDGNR